MTAGDIYTVAGNGTGIFSGEPGGVAVNASGQVLVADTFSNRIRLLTG